MIKLSQLVLLNTGSDEMLPMIYMSIVDDEDIPAFERIYEECKDKAYMTAFDI